MTVFIQIGDAPLSVRQATKRGLQIVDLELHNAGARPGDRDILVAVPHADLPDRLLAVVTALGHPSYADYAAAWETDNAVNAAHNLINHQAAAYAEAAARLARYRLADGQPEVNAEQETGSFDEAGEPIFASVTLQHAIAPLPVRIEQPVQDLETGELIGTELVVNPLVLVDDTERSAANAVILATPPEAREAAPAALPVPPAGVGWVWTGALWAIDANSAESSVLQELDGVGPALAAAIIAARPYASPTDLDAVSGISAAMVSAWQETPGLVAMQSA